MIFDITTHWYEIWNTIRIAISFSAAMKMICALMFIMSQHHGKNVVVIYYSYNHVINFCNAKKMICALMFKWVNMIKHHGKNVVVIYYSYNHVINFCNAKKMICALMFIKCNQYWIQCLSNLLQLELCNVMKVLSDMAHWYDYWISIVIQITFCNAKKMICVSMFIISNHGSRNVYS